MLKAFKRIKSDADILNKVQRNIEVVLNPIISANIIDGTLLQNVSLVSGSDNVIDPQLGREVQGWIITRRRASATVWDLQDSSSSSSRTLTLRSSADVEIDLWVF